jgi:hypothetical protein
LESDLSDLLRWLNTWKVSAQTLASTDPENPDLQEKLQVGPLKNTASMMHLQVTLGALNLALAKGCTLGSMENFLMS